jgi:phage-related protein
MLDVLFDGESLTDVFGITLSERPVIPVANAVYSEYSVPGRNGALQIFENYDDVPINLKFNYIDKRAKPKFREIVNWLSDKETFRLSDSQNYRVLTQPLIGISDGTNDIKGWCDFELDLLTESFEYEDVGTEKIEDEIILYNPSQIDAPVIMRVYGNGVCRVRINGDLIELIDVQEQTTIDGVLKIAHRGGASQDNNMSGQYPLLLPGENTISVEGSTEYVEVDVRWCWR